jgi:carbon storage regulator CsrA
MLVLTRKVQQQIQVGQDITITIVRIKGNTVRVGIEAPRSVRVARGEALSTQAAAPAYIELAADEDASAGPQAEAPGDEPIGTSPTARQAGRDARRGPLGVSRQEGSPVPFHAV